MYAGPKKTGLLGQEGVRVNIARSGSDGFWWHVADSLTGIGIYLRMGQQDGVVLPRDEAEALLEGLKEVLHGS